MEFSRQHFSSVFHPGTQDVLNLLGRFEIRFGVDRNLDAAPN
jgi:hypothetical protein